MQQLALFLTPRLSIRAPAVRVLTLALIAGLVGLPAHAQVPPPPPPAATSPAPVAPAPSGKQRVLVLHTESAAMADPARLAVSRDVYAHALRYRQLDVVPSNADLVEEMFEFECTEAGVDCLARIGAKYGAQLVVYSEVAKAGAGWQLNMRVIDVTAARVAQSTAQPLELDKAQNAIARALVVLLGPVDLAAAEAPGTLKISLFGGGVALVYVDDQLVGNTADAQGVSVPAGTHTVRVVRAGFREWTARIAVPAGGRAERTVQLEQLATVPPGGNGAVKETPLTHKWWFWTAIGVAVVGGTAIALAATSSTAKVSTGAASFTLDSSSAHLDPVFGPGVK